MSGLMHDLRAAIDQCKLAGCLVYAISDVLETGKVILVKETDWHYEFWVFATEDEAQMVAQTTGQTLLHVRDAPSKSRTVFHPSIKVENYDERRTQPARD